MHQQLMTAINEKKSYQPSNSDKENQGMEKLRQANSMLSETIAKCEMKNNELISKNQKLKAYHKCFKNSMASQCKFCHSFYPTEVFLEHFRTCSKDMNNFSRSHFFQMRVDCQIKDTVMVDDPMDNRTYTEYSIQVSFNNEKTWVLSRKYKEFCHLHESLINQYPSIQFPQSSYQFANKNFNEIKRNSACPGSGGGPTPNMVNDRKNILQSYLQDLVMIPSIKESNQLKAFLGIKEQYPEFYNEAWDHHISGEKSQKPELPGFMKEFMVEKKEDKSSELLKFITNVNPKPKDTKSNMRYSVKNEVDSPMIEQPPKPEKQFSLQGLLINSGRQHSTDDFKHAPTV